MHREKSNKGKTKWLRSTTKQIRRHRPVWAGVVLVSEVLCSKAEPSSGKALWCLKKTNIGRSEGRSWRAFCSKSDVKLIITVWFEWIYCSSSNSFVLKCTIKRLLGKRVQLKDMWKHSHHRIQVSVTQSEKCSSEKEALGHSQHVVPWRWSQTKKKKKLRGYLTTTGRWEDARKVTALREKVPLQTGRAPLAVRAAAAEVHCGWLVL